MSMKDIILFGVPWCGKGTQAELLLEKLGDALSHLSTGDVFRALTSQPNAIGKYVKNRMESGMLIDDQVTIWLFHSYFYTVLDDKKYMLLDGYPRSIEQMNDLQEIAQKNNRKVVWIYFQVFEEETIKRILWRGRPGETEDVIRIRLQEYYTHTQPILDAFSQRWELIKVDANGSVEDIHIDVMKAVQ